MFDKKIRYNDKTIKKSMADSDIGRLSLTMDRKMIEKLRKIAKSNDRSMSSQIRVWILENEGK